MEKKLLLVTFPVDLGNITYEKRLIGMFGNHLDLRIHRFVPDQIKHLSYTTIIGKRILGSYELWKEVCKAQNEKRKILFHGISPALFAYPVTIHGSSFIVTDWTRKLYESIWENSMSPSWLTFIHKKVLNSQKYVFGLTNAVIKEMAKDYNVPQNKLKKVRLPFSFDLNLFTPSPNREDNEVRILFVGGDFHRKGGDVLLNWFMEYNAPNLIMTMVTKYFTGSHSKVTIETNVEFGQPKHIDLFKNHDIFVIPTKCDGYPSVLGEAACAGLAILTTKNALGAPEVVQNGVNGYICESQEELLNKLSTLIENKPLIESMKRKSRELMEKEFASDLVFNEFISYIFKD